MAYKHITTLNEFILEEEHKIQEATGSLTILLTHLEIASKIIASHIKRSGLVDIVGTTGNKNVYEEDILKLDELSNTVLIEMLLHSRRVYAIASEELEKPLLNKNEKEAKYIIFLDPLDGSSNVDTTINVGTIFSIYKKENSLLQQGKKQVAAGYIIYGSSVMFVYSCGHGVNGFTLDPAIGSYLLSHPQISIPQKGNIYSINEGYYSYYSSSHKKYLDYVKKKNMKMRYVGSMVADVHRTLLKGGIFLYPKDQRNPHGKLRLMHEVNPLSFIIEQAGGKAYTDGENPLIIRPISIHQRVPLILGSEKNIEEYLQFME